MKNNTRTIRVLDDPDWSGLWAVAEMECAICGHEQISVYPACCEQLECGDCGYMMDAPELEHGR